jgi:hypothetical protein
LYISKTENINDNTDIIYSKVHNTLSYVTHTLVSTLFELDNTINNFFVIISWGGYNDSTYPPYRFSTYGWKIYDADTYIEIHKKLLLKSGILKIGNTILTEDNLIKLLSKL